MPSRDPTPNKRASTPQRGTSSTPRGAPVSAVVAAAYNAPPPTPPPAPRHVRYREADGAETRPHSLQSPAKGGGIKNRQSSPVKKKMAAGSPYAGKGGKKPSFGGSSSSRRITMENDQYDDLDEAAALGSPGSQDNSLDDEANAEMRSRSSGGTGTTATEDIVKSTLPCNMSMTFVMIILIMIPVTFLVAYTALPLATAVEGSDHISSHRHDIDAIVFLGRALQAERRASTVLLISAVGSAAESAAQGELAAVRTNTDERLLTLSQLQLNSDLDFRQTILNQMVNLTDTISQMRKRMDSRVIDGPDVRDKLLSIIEDVYAMVNYISKDKRGESFKLFLLLFTVMRRIQNTFGAEGSVGRAILAREGHEVENYATMYSLRMSLKRDRTLILSVGSEDQLHEIEDYIDTSPQGIRFRKSIDAFLSKNETIWSALVDPVQFLADADWLTDSMGGEHDMDLDLVQSNLQSVAVGEGMKMMGGILACIIATVFVIWLNNRESTRLEAALIGAHAMSKAVQRFVPKNQLKSMGVRSILQVSRGLATEISQVMLYTDVRDFTKLASTMNNTELFDWLQNYVERLSTVTEKHNGYVSAVIGDAVYSIYHQPTDGMRAAIQVHVATDKLNVEIVAGGKKRMVNIGVGVHYGVLVAGVFGDESRLSCVHIAAHVSLPSHLEALTTVYGAKIVASDAVVDNINLDLFSIRCLGYVTVEGSVQPVLIYDCFDADVLPVKQMKRETKREFEHAVHHLESHPEQAKADFERLALDARSKLLRDVAAEKRSGLHFGDESSFANSEDEHAAEDDVATPVMGVGDDTQPPGAVDIPRFDKPDVLVHRSKRESPRRN